MRDLLRKSCGLFSCEHYSELASRRLVEPIPWYQVPFFWLHHMICMVCRRYGRQIKAIQDAAHEHHDHLDQGGGEGLTAERRAEIQQALSDEAGS